MYTNGDLYSIKPFFVVHFVTESLPQYALHCSYTIKHYYIHYHTKNGFYNRCGLSIGFICLRFFLTGLPVFPTRPFSEQARLGKRWLRPRVVVSRSSPLGSRKRNQDRSALTKYLRNLLEIRYKNLANC